MLCAAKRARQLYFCLQNKIKQLKLRIMLHTLTLLLPALMPSWRFFDVIAPSPRIEYALLKTKTEIPHHWQEFRPRPTRLSFMHMLGRMFYNPKWNESLFLVSCAERIMQGSTEHSIQEIVSRMNTELLHQHTNIQATPYMQFRLVYVWRSGDQLDNQVVFNSVAHSLLADDRPCH